MELILKELVDIQQLQAILDDLYNISGLPSTIFDINGEKLTDSGWEELCTKFYRSNPEANLVCQSNKRGLIGKVIKGKSYVVDKCPFGINSIGSPIIVDGKPIAVITIGQFFLEEPDAESYLQHIDYYSFDKKAFMNSFNKIPVITIDKALNVASFVEKFAEIIAEMSLTNLKLKKNEEIISGINFKLESVVEERTKELTESNKLLEAAMDKYKILINNLPCAVMITSPINDEIIYANSETAKIFGVSDGKEIIGKQLDDIFEFNDSIKDRRDEQVKYILEHGYKPATIENLIRKSDNKLIEAETSSSVIQFDNNSYILVLIRDNTERLDALELQKNIEHKTRLLNKIMEYDKLKTEFLANISHELRTPINIIFCSLQMLNMYNNNNQSPNTANMNKHINMMKQNCYRLIRLIDNLIDVTKIDNGSFKLNLVNANIIKIIQNITMSITDYAKSKDLSISFASSEESVVIACDPDKIERIILNLLSNSIKFTQPSGTISVNITNDNEKLLISVKDTGVGIPKEKRQTVFERFSQLDRSLSRHQEGSGIGLSLVKSLVEMHKGSIYINPEYNTGCDIIIELPIIRILDNENEIIDRNMVNNIERIMIEFSDIYDYNS